MPRNKPPPRRRTIREKIEFQADGGAYQQVFVDIGFTPQGVAVELFLRPANTKSGSTLERLYDDLGVLLSLLLQHGYNPDGLLRRLGWLGGEPLPGGGIAPPTAPASVVGHAMLLAKSLENQCRQAPENQSPGSAFCDSNLPVDE